mgnify:CR=1 FL=1
MKIITTVGTSLISNSNVNCDDLEHIKFSEELFDGKNDSSTKKVIANKEEKLLQFLNGGNTCAELATLKKIDPEAKSDIYLLCTETVTGYMCGRVLQRHLGEKAKIQIIPGLQVKDAKKFEQEGFFNLVEAVKAIKNDEAEVLLNISGGYKALIPPLTLLAQLERIPLYYMYEDSEEVIETGSLPISFDWEVIEQYHVFLHNANKRNNDASDEAIEEMRSLKLIKPDSRDLTIVGILLSQYSNRASPFTERIFGYFIEHKVNECYANDPKYGREKVEHSVKLEGMGTEDIDVLITPEAGKFISVEIKPSNVLGDAGKMQSIQEAFITRVNIAKTERGKPVEIWLLVYSYTDKKNDTRSMTDNEKAIAENLAKEIRKGIDDDLTFKVLHFFIERNKLSGESHIYQTFMKKPLKSDKIKEIFNSSNSKP